MRQTPGSRGPRGRSCADSTAAGGLRAYNPNRNAAKVNTPVGRAGERRHALVHRRSVPGVQAVGAAQGRGQFVQQRFRVGPVLGVVRRRREGRLPDWDHVGIASEPRGMQRLRRVRVGLGRRRVGSGQREWRDVEVPRRRRPAPATADPRGRRVNRPGRPVVGQVRGKRPGLAKNDVRILPRTYSPPE